MWPTGLPSYFTWRCRSGIGPPRASGWPGSPVGPRSSARARPSGWTRTREPESSVGAERRWPRSWIHQARGVLSGVLIIVLIAFVLPTVTGSDWRSAIDTLSLVTVGQLAALTALWLVGVWAYTFVMAACLPGLRKMQALALYM